MVLPKLKRHLNAKNTLSNHNSIHGHRNLNYIERSAIARHRNFKGEVRAICRFWVFDGNGLLGHRLIDSRWFEKNPPTESGWKRRSKKTRTYRYFARKWSWCNMCFQVRAISSRLWFTYIFVFDSGSLSIAGGWRKCGTLLIFLSDCSTRVRLAAPGKTRSPSKRICRGTLLQKTRNWPTCKPVHVHERSRERRRSFDPASLCRQLDSVGVLLRKQEVLMLTFMVNLVALSPSHKEAHS